MVIEPALVRLTKRLPFELGMNLELKECRHCHVVKSRDQFSPEAGKRDGLHSWCKLCVADAAAKRRGATASVALARAKRDMQATLAKRGLKECRKCRQVKPCGEFSPAARKNHDSLSSWCKACAAAASAAWRRTKKTK